MKSRKLATLLALPEEIEQKDLAKFLDLKIGEPGWCHPPNGGKRNKIVAAKLKAQGVKKGVPDVLIFICSKKLTLFNYVGVAIELKKTDMRPSDLKSEQSSWLQCLKDNGWLTFVAKGAGAAMDFLIKWGY